MALPSSDTNIPLASKFQPVDTVNNLQNAYTLAGQKIKVDEQVQEKNDMGIVQDYLKSGGDLHSQEGVDKAVQSLKGRVSPKTYQDLTTYGQNFQKWSLGISEQIAKLGPERIASADAQNEFITKHLEAAYDSYDKGWKSRLTQRGLNPNTAPESEINQAKIDAQADFNASKQAILAGVQQPGQGQVDPKLVEQFKDMDPDAVAQAIKRSKFMNERTKQALEIAHKQASTLKEQEDYNLKREKIINTTIHQMQEAALAEVTAAVRANPKDPATADRAFLIARAKMEARINDLFNNGKAQSIGLTEDDRKNFIADLPHSLAELEEKNKAVKNVLGSLQESAPLPANQVQISQAPAAPLVAPRAPAPEVPATPLPASNTPLQQDVTNGLNETGKAKAVAQELQSQVLPIKNAVDGMTADVTQQTQEQAPAVAANPYNTPQAPVAAQAQPTTVPTKPVAAPAQQAAPVAASTSPVMTADSEMQLANEKRARAAQEYSAGNKDVGKRLTQEADKHIEAANKLTTQAQRAESNRIAAERLKTAGINAKAKEEQNKAGELSPDEVKISAAQLLYFGTEPRGGWSGISAKNRAMIHNERARQAKALGLSDAEAAILPQDNKVKMKAVSTLTTWGANIERIEQELVADFDNLLGYAKKIKPGQLKILNEGIIAGKREFNNPIYNAYAANVETVRSKWGRMMTGPTSNAMLPVEALKKSSDMISKGYDVPSWEEIKRTMIADANNTMKATRDTIDSLHGSMTTGKSPAFHEQPIPESKSGGPALNVPPKSKTQAAPAEKATKDAKGKEIEWVGVSPDYPSGYRYKAVK